MRLPQLLLRHGADGLSIARRGSPGNYSQTSGLRGRVGNVPSSGRKGLWDHTASSRQLGGHLQYQGANGLEGVKKRAAARGTIERLAGCDDHAGYHGSLSRPIEAPLLPVDTGGCGTTDSKALWGAPLGMDGGTSFGTVGLHQSNPSSTLRKMMCLLRKELERARNLLALQRDFPCRGDHSRTVGGAATPAACNTVWHTPRRSVRRYSFLPCSSTSTS
jgi:hypothetical protein